MKPRPLKQVAKNPMPRPLRPYPIVVVPLKLTLTPGRDDDILAFLAAVPPRQRAAAVLRVMRGGLAAQPPPPGAQEEADAILAQLGELWN